MDFETALVHKIPVNSSYIAIIDYASYSLDFRNVTAHVKKVMSILKM